MSLVFSSYIGSSASTDTKREATISFAEYLNKFLWGFGACENDLVVVLAVAERQVSYSNKLKIYYYIYFSSAVQKLEPTALWAI